MTGGQRILLNFFCFIVGDIFITPFHFFHVILSWGLVQNIGVIFLLPPPIDEAGFKKMAFYF